VLLNSDGSIQDSCVQAYPTILNQVMDSRILRKFLPESTLWGNAVLFSKENAISNVDTLSGAFLMVRKKVFVEIGGFDETYFMYAEDRDLCFRVAKAGYRVVIDKCASVIHHGGGSTSSDGVSRFSNIMMRNSTYEYFRKHKGPVYAKAYRVSMSGNALVRLCLLFLSAPVISVRQGRFPAGSFSKWGHIFMWALGCENTRKTVSP
jgi:N-acetylglucosaminyl-diphospho-decaprenol L-rhamnosyltransferase